MQAFDADIYDIVAKGLEGNGLSENETLLLCEVEETSKEAALIRWAGQELSMEAADGIAEIHAQIGLNSTMALSGSDELQPRASQGPKAPLRASSKA